MTCPSAAIGAVCFCTFPHGVLVKRGAPVSPLKALRPPPATNQTMAFDKPSVDVEMGWCLSSPPATAAHQATLGVAGVVVMSTRIETSESPPPPLGDFASSRASTATWTPDAEM